MPLHRTLLGLVPGGNIAGAVLDLLPTPGQRGGKRRKKAARLSPAHVAQHRAGVDVAGHAGHGHHQQFLIDVGQAPDSGGQVAQTGAAFSGPCNPPMFMDPTSGICLSPGSPASMDVAGGQVVMGRYGAGMIPNVETRRHRDCLPGMVLGDDGICYNRRDLRNSEREYPKPRAPLLTGGERNAITTARRAAGKIERVVKSLQEMGMMKKPAPRKVRAAPVRHALTPGPSIINVE